ncbi:MAG: hypothetical protein ABI580_06765 [Burkholderiaceae bacterium]
MRYPVTHRQTLQTALAVAALASVALAGCNNKHGNTAAARAAGTSAASIPTQSVAALTPMTVTTVDLGHSVGDDNRVEAPTTDFATADTIHASVASAGDIASTLTAKWMFQDGQTVATTTKSVAGGSQVTDFSISKPDGWPPGNYTLEVQKNGATVQTREFEVK